MYIPYDKIGNSLALFLPSKWRKSVRGYFLELKTLRNCAYIEKNSRKVLKKLRKEVKIRKLRVAFLCNERTKWKCESLYNLFLESKNFHPFILASKYNAPKYAATVMTAENVMMTYDFFKNKRFETYYAYNVEEEQFVPIKEFNPDIIFYQEPWYVETSQGPVVASKFALTYYVPYFVTNISTEIEYGLRFHRYLHKHYVVNDLIFKYYSERMKNKGKNLTVTGHTQLDYFYLHKEDIKEKKYVIYAPHWSIDFPAENYATFKWNGLHILKFAKSHPEINWVFKPHPSLKHRLEAKRIMSRDEIEDYWQEWDKISLRYESGDYLDIFSQSYAMITDCGSFLTEYFMTGQPVIHLISAESAGYNPSAQEVVKNYYKAHNISELDALLEKVIIKKDDPMKEQRLAAIKDLGFKDVYAAKNILDDIKEELNIL